MHKNYADIDINKITIMQIVRSTFDKFNGAEIHRMHTCNRYIKIYKIFESEGSTGSLYKSIRLHKNL